MHFKLDENIPVALQRKIIERGHSASTVVSEKISGITDRQLLHLCRKDRYILLTFDTDFCNVQAYPPVEHEGIIVFNLKNQSLSSLLSAFDQVVQTVNLAQIKNATIIVEKEYVRVRK